LIRASHGMNGKNGQTFFPDIFSGRAMRTSGWDRQLRRLFILFFGLVATAVGASLITEARAADRRVALIIGNSAYQNAPGLQHPVNDAVQIGKMFEAIGFKVDVKPNLSIADMRRVLRGFIDTVRDADVAVVFFAGHGIEVDGT